MTDGRYRGRRVASGSVSRVVGLLLLLCPSWALSAVAQSVERASAGRVSVRAEGKSLGDVLRELRTVVDIEVLLIEASVDSRPVSLTLKDVDEEDAIWEILDAAAVDGIVVGKKGEPFRVYAGKQATSIGPKRIQLSPSEPPPPPAREQPQPTTPTEANLSEDAAPGEARPDGAQPQRRPEETRPVAPPAPEAPRTATGDASLSREPGARQLALLGAMLGSGLLLGLTLVVRDS